MREIRRNKPPFYDYFNESAHQLAIARRIPPRHAKKRPNISLYDLVVNKISKGWSPDAIAGRLRRENSLDKSMHVSY